MSMARSRLEAGTVEEETPWKRRKGQVGQIKELKSCRLAGMILDILAVSSSFESFCKKFPSHESRCH